MALLGQGTAVVWAGAALGYLWLNREFLGFARRSFGAARAVGFGLLGFCDHVACALGMAAGVLAGRRPRVEAAAAEVRSEGAP